MTDGNRENSSWLRTQMRELNLSARQLATGIGVKKRQVFNLISGKSRLTPERKTLIDRFLATKRKYNNEISIDSNPHAELLETLTEASESCMKYEVVGMPGMLKTLVLDELNNRLNDKQENYLYFRDLGTWKNISGFWRSVGDLVLGNALDHTVEDIKEAMREKHWTLLLDDADLFLHNVLQTSGDTGEASQWIKHLNGLPAAVILTSAISTKELIGLASGGASPFGIGTELELRSWWTPKEWELWTTAVLRRDVWSPTDVRTIKTASMEIPLVFREGIRALKAHKKDGPERSKDTMTKIHHSIATSIWRRLPAASRTYLAETKFAFSLESRLSRALLKSGILLPGELKPRGEDWLQTWRSEADTKP